MAKEGLFYKCDKNYRDPDTLAHLIKGTVYKVESVDHVHGTVTILVNPFTVEVSADTFQRIFNTS